MKQNRNRDQCARGEVSSSWRARCEGARSHQGRRGDGTGDQILEPELQSESLARLGKVECVGQGGAKPLSFRRSQKSKATGDVEAESEEVMKI